MGIILSNVPPLRINSGEYTILEYIQDKVASSDSVVIASGHHRRPQGYLLPDLCVQQVVKYGIMKNTSNWKRKYRCVKLKRNNHYE